ncbi:MAG TPA: methylmalonyl Co-A mutase-associated GTPase MeaB, partial [Actinomycetota bacterium]|nr:methylmalonyl Co-A mutase-associated GTPase MeaB [Actinomycetota bacterium]
SPGAGKSTLASALVKMIRKQDLTVSVLAIDPSSPFTGGALLGDRLRMQEHATDPGVFIRSMATRGHLGGLSWAVPHALRVLDAAGADVIVLETVGVGQAEVDVAHAADTTLVVLAPGMGDSVQANKAGILEIADLFVVNKADKPGVRQTVRDIEQMLHLGVATAWTPPVLQTVAEDGSGVEELWAGVEQHRAHLESTGELRARRVRRAAREISEIALAELRKELGEPGESALLDGLAEDVVEGRIDPYSAADRLGKS